MITSIGLALGIMLLLGLASSKLAKKIHVPNVTGYLVAGLVLGPALIGFINPEWALISTEFVEGMKIIAEIALLFVAFTVGAEFKLSFIKQVGIVPVVIAFLESFFAVVFIAVVLIIFGFPVPFSIILGAIGGATAPAATIMTIRQYKAEGDFTRTVLSVVALDDASALIFFGFAVALGQSLLNPQSSVALMIILPFLEIILSLVIGALLGLVLTFLTKWFTGRGNRLTSVVAILLLGLGLIEILNDAFSMEMSTLLTAMMLGAVYTNLSSEVEKVIPLVERFTPPIIMLFFVLSGADLHLEAMSLIGLGITAIYFIMRIGGKLFGTWLGGKLSHASDKVQKWLGLGLLPQGGIAIGLSLVAMDVLPVEVDPVYNGMLIRVVVLAAVLISELIGPSFLRIALVKTGEARVS